MASSPASHWVGQNRAGSPPSETGEAPPRCSTAETGQSGKPAVATGGETGRGGHHRGGSVILR
jgi:hypothetical protein